MWDGIDVLGTSLPQVQANQGLVLMSSNATIANARIGIEIGTAQTAGIPVNGGYVQATGAKFLNNYIDVQTYKYTGPGNQLGNTPDNVTFFSGCQFIGDRLLKDPDYTDAQGNRITNYIHASLYGVKNIKFQNCLFKTDLTNLPPNYKTDNRSYGIKAFAASFITTPNCIAQDPFGNCVYGPGNNFENLRYGVYAESPNPVYNQFIIKKTNFTNCYSGIYHSGINYCKVEQNNFLINTTIPLVTGKTCFLNPIPCSNYFYYATNSSAFSHQENAHSVIGNQFVLGSIFNACGTGANQSYKNSYNNLYTGQQYQLVNGSAGFGVNGLQFKCNQHITTKSYDFLQTSGTMGEQGYCSGSPLTPANNLFTHFNQAIFSDINALNGSGFIYNYPGNPFNGLQVPFYPSPNVATNGCVGPAFNYNSNTCPSQLVLAGNGNGGGSLINQLQQKALGAQQSIDQINQSLLAGASPALITSINNPNLSAGAIKNLLMQSSPYLSDAVLLAYIQSNPQAGLLKDVIMANSPLSEAVLQAVNNANLPAGTKNEINSAQGGISAHTRVLNEIAYWTYTRDLTVNEIIRYYLEDQTVNQLNEIIKWLKWNPSVESKRDLIFFLMGNNDFSSAQNLIDSLNTAEQNPKYLKFVQACKNMYSANQDWSVVKYDFSLMAMIEPTAEDSLSPMMSNARTVIRLAYNKFYDSSLPTIKGNEGDYWEDEETEEYENYENYEWVEGVQQNNNRLIHQHKNDKKVNVSVTDDSRLTAYAFPNPSTNFVNVAFSLKDEKWNLPIDLLLIEVGSGRVIQKHSSEKLQDLVQFNTTDLAPGVYFISIRQNGECLTNLKIVNIR